MTQYLKINNFIPAVWRYPDVLRNNQSHTSQDAKTRSWSAPLMEPPWFWKSYKNTSLEPPHCLASSGAKMREQ